jgi:hypothetical protein
MRRRNLTLLAAVPAIAPLLGLAAPAAAFGNR